MKAGKVLNSWGAKATTVQELHPPNEKCLEIDKHQVTTSNVDEFRWKQGVKFYI